MALLGLPDLQDGVQSPDKILIELVSPAGVFPDQISQLHRIAQGIDLIFALPQPIGHLRLVVLPTVAVLLLIEGVGIGVVIDEKELPSGQPHQQIRDLAVLFGRHQVRAHLGYRIPQPHGGNVPGDHVSRPILHLFDCGVQRIGKAVDEQLHHGGIVLKSLFHPRDQTF